MANRGFWVWPVIVAGLLFAGLSAGVAQGPASPLWGAEYLLYALMIGAFARGGLNLSLSPRRAALAFVLLSLCCGAVYESSLTVDGSGLGGVHPDTRASYLLALGDYLPIALVTLALTRLWHLRFADAFWLALGKSLTEGLIFTGVLMANLTSPVAPLMLGYYTLAYGSFVALPLLILAPQALWSPHPRSAPSVPVLILTGFAAAFVIRLFWGLAWSPFATWAFALPANTVP